MNKKRFKTIGLIVLGVLVLIVFFQNTDTAQLKFLAWELQAPRVVLFPVLFALGFLAGVLTLLLVQRRRRKEEKAGARADKAVKEMEKEIETEGS